MKTPTPAELKAEVESGPLSAALLPFWSDVFQSEDEPAEDDEAGHARWDRIKSRFGTLTSDGAAGCLGVLRDPARRTRTVAVGLPVFTNFLMARGLLKALIDGQGHADPQVASVCWGVVLLIQGASDRAVDPSDPATAGMVNALVAGGVFTRADADAFAAFCTRPASRLDELGWTVTVEDFRAAKAA